MTHELLPIFLYVYIYRERKGERERERESFKIFLGKTIQAEKKTTVPCLKYRLYRLKFFQIMIP